MAATRSEAPHEKVDALHRKVTGLVDQRRLSLGQWQSSTTFVRRLLRLASEVADLEISTMEPRRTDTPFMKTATAFAR